MMNLILSLAGYLLVVLGIDTKKRDLIPEKLTIRYVMNSLKFSLIMLGIVLIIVVIEGNWLRMNPGVTVIVIAIYTVLVPWIRMLSLSVESEISKRVVFRVTVIGFLITNAIVWLPLSVLFFLSSMQ